jgi:hypothetical protein
VETNARSPLAWLTVALAGFAAPGLAMLLLPLDAAGPPVLATAMMGAGMIAAAAAGRFVVGATLALAAGLTLSLILGAHALPLVLTIAAASVSFAARGTLFARSAGKRGWWIALAVLAGEGAMLALAVLDQGAVPDWLLALLPAQWASMGIAAALAGQSSPAPLAALAGTAATTMLVARLWPARWPYLVMFTAWLGFATIVWHAGTLAG